MYIWDRRSSRYTAIYLPLLQLKLIWTITQKITFLSQFICSTLIALLFTGTVAMEMGEWSFCWYHCIIKGHWDCLGQEIIFRVQLLGGVNVIPQKFCVWVMWLLPCHPKLNYEPHWLQAKSQIHLPILQISSKPHLCAAAFSVCPQAYRTTKLWSPLPLVSWTVVTGYVIAPDHFELCVNQWLVLVKASGGGNLRLSRV